jgi:hypothetical protein
MGSNVAKIKGLNVEDHIATTPTRPQKIHIRVGSWYSTAITGQDQVYLMGCEIKSTHIDMWLYVTSH